MLVFGNGVSLLAVLLACGAAAGCLWAAYRRVLRIRDYGAWLPRALLALRFGAVVLCLLLIVNPIFKLNATPRDSQRIVVLVDTSRSMAIHDSVGGAARIDAVRRILDDQGLLTALGNLAKVQVATFDTGLHGQSTAGLPVPLTANGDGTLLSKALDEVRNGKDPVPLSAIVLFTDGGETSPLTPNPSPQRGEGDRGVPIYAVGIGSLHEALAQMPDIALTGVKCDPEAFVHTKVEVKVDLRETNLDNEQATVQILRAPAPGGGGATAILAEQTAVFDKDEITVPLEFTPEQTGLFDLQARVVPHPKEKITENNSRYFAVKVTDKKLRVFYYEGTPRWSYKFLLRELKRDPQLALQAVLRTNPDRLYQSSAAADSRAVLFPATRAALKNYDCVILGDLRQTDLTRAQADALRQYISEDGGGLIVLGGKESFAPGGLTALGLEPLLPVALDGVREVTGAFAVTLTPDGATHPALAGLTRFPPLESIYTTGALKPGAQALLKAEADKTLFPLAIAQRYGTGRVFLFASDADWKWVMKLRGAEGDTVFGKLWGQAIRWAANREIAPEKQAAVTVSTEKDIYQIDEPVRIYVQGLPSPLRGEGPGVRGSTAEPTPLTPNPSPQGGEGDGIAEAVVGDEKVPLNKSMERLEGLYRPAKPGLYHVTAGGAACEFLVERPAGEMDRLALDDMLLRQLAASSGGQYFDALTVKNLPDALRSSGHIKAEVREYVFSESWLPFLVILVALGGEWALRKRMQVI